MVRPLSAGSIATAAAAAIFASSASAAFIVPDGVNAPWVRGVTANSAWAQWDAFSSASGPNSPDVGNWSSSPLADGAPAWSARDLSGTSLVTGSGNIYAPRGPLQAEITSPGFGLGAGHTTTILLQVRTQGTEVNPATVFVNGVAPVATTELYREALGGFGGFIVETLWRFELAGNASSYTIRFDALGPHMSLDQVSVDTLAQVPVPGALAAFAAGAGLLGRRRRLA